MFVLLYSIVKLRIKDIRLTRTSLYYWQFALSLPKERSHIFFKCKPLNMNIRLIQTLFMPPPPPPRPPFLSVRTMGFDHTIKPCFTETRLIRTPRSYGHFFLMPPPPPSMSVQTGFDHTVKPFFTDTPFIRTLFVNGPFSILTNGVWLQERLYEVFHLWDHKISLEYCQIPFTG